MTLTNITGREKRRFKKLQDEGLLPSEALRKIESERRLGIVPEDKFFFKEENIGLYLALGAIGIAIIYVYIKSPSQTSTLGKLNNDLKLDDIKGINIQSLNECRMKGLM